jgi:hypothetical protein
MAIRRPHRSIETFDISLMAVVTKAMGAFLVMMLLLIPSYIAVPEMQTKLSDIEAETRQLEQKAASLAKQNQELEQENIQIAAQQRQAEQEQRIATLQQGNATRQNPNNRMGGFPALIIFFDWAKCAPKDIDFYVERANAPGWPEVRPGRQPLPPGVFEYPTEKLKALVTELTDVDAMPFNTAIVDGTARQRLWIVNWVLPDTTYAFYAKASGLEEGCKVAANVLLTASHSVQYYPGIFQWYATLEDRIVHRQSPEQSRQIFVLARLHWDGEKLTYDGVNERDLPMGKTLWDARMQARARDQKELDERLAKQGIHN